MEATLGPIVGVQAHGDRGGWIGLMLDHQVGRFSEASMSATSAPDTTRADVEIFGPGGSATVDCTGASSPEAYQTMYREFADAVQRGSAPPLDADHIKRPVRDGNRCKAGNPSQHNALAEQLPDQIGVRCPERPPH